jgi:hypothetical protein
VSKEWLHPFSPPEYVDEYDVLENFDIFQPYKKNRAFLSPFKEGINPAILEQDYAPGF